MGRDTVQGLVLHCLHAHPQRQGKFCNSPGSQNAPHFVEQVLPVRFNHLLSGYSIRFVYVLLWCIFKTWLPQSDIKN